MVGRADSASDIHLFVCNIIPESVARGKQGIVPGKTRNIRHTGIQIDSAHRMAYRLLLFPHRKV